MALRQLWSRINDQLYLGNTHTHTQRNELLCGVLWAQTPKLHKALVCPESWAKLGWCCISGNLIIATRCPQSAWEEGENRSTKGKTRFSPPEWSRCIISIVYQKAYKTIPHIIFLDFISTLIRIHPNHHKLEHRLSFTTNAQPTPCCYWDCKSIISVSSDNHFVRHSKITGFLLLCLKQWMLS